MALLFVQFLVFYDDKNLPKCRKIGKVITTVVQCKINPQRIAKDFYHFTKMARVRNEKFYPNPFIQLNVKEGSLANLIKLLICIS